ncbi:MAG: ribosomal protein S18-alanine N-acetyltransferase [Fibrobacteres bacterium]|jgi:ribosomal-protein-alanine N-acetyltransferase|nr:ribosomal protein S18-alanine N-acetyltransferase [Fibrobacterota bacterium]
MSLADAGMRAMEVRDLVAVCALDALCQGSPWTKGQFRDELDRGEDGFCCVVDAEPGALAAYLCAWIAADELTIGTIGVDPARRRCGLARSLVWCAHDWAISRGGAIAHLEVRAGNAAAIALYEALGYRRVGVRRGYYSDNGEDAYLLLADLPGVEVK